MPSQRSRSGTVLVIIIGLIAALALIATLFLSEIMGSRSSSREYRKRSVARAAAVAGREHAIAVLTQQYRDEVATKGASTEASPYRLAFIPDAAGASEVPARPGTPLESTSHIFAEVASWGSWQGTDDEGRLTSIYNCKPVRLNNLNCYSRFIDQALYDEKLRPVTDPAEAFYRARYDVLIVNLDTLPHVQQDLGDDAYRPLGSRSTFVAQDSRMFNTTASALGSGDGELQVRRDMAWQYAHVHARGLVSMLTSTPSHFYDGIDDAPLWSEVVRTPEGVRPAPGATYWLYSTGGGGTFSDLAHLRFGGARRYSRDYSASDYRNSPRYDYQSDTVRHVADLFHGVGFGRFDNEAKQLYHDPSLAITFNHDDRVTGSAHPLLQKYNGVGFYATAGERPFTPKMAWTHLAHSTRSYEKSEVEQYTPFGSGIVGHDPAVDTADMDVGGVPWEVNPLSAGKEMISHMVVGLSPQLLAASWALAHNDWNGRSIDNNTGALSAIQTEATYYDNPYMDGGGETATVRGYDLGFATMPGNHSLELLWDPPMPDGSEHTARSATGISARFGSDPGRLDYAWAGLNPFYDPTFADAGYDPATTQEHPQQLYRYLDGVYDPAGNASTDQRLDRFLNRLRYIRWVSWKHEFGSSSPIIERRLAELDTAVTYEEGLRYYRRPSAKDLNADIGPSSMREGFDSSAESLGVVVDLSYATVPNPDGGTDQVGPRQKKGKASDPDRPVSIAPASRADGAAKRYRIFPHTYPGPMWTGREGRSEVGGTGWSNPVTGVDRYGNGASETLWSEVSDNSAEHNLIEQVFQMRIRPPGGDGARRESATDSFFWDVAMANLYAIAMAHDIGDDQYRAGGVTVTIEDIDRLAASIIGAQIPGGGYGFDDNLIVTQLYNPAEPVDVDGNGSYDPAGADVIPGVDLDGDGSYDDLDGDGSVDTDLPAVRDPAYIYGQYNRYWPVEDPLIPHPELDPALGSRPFASVLAAVNGTAISGAMGDWKLGATWDEIQTFSGKDFYYHHPRQLLMAAMVLNDVRQSLYGAGEPETVETLAARAATTIPGLGRLVTGGAGTREVFVAGRAQDPSTGRPKPFSRTGRFVIKPDRLYRVMIRSQLVNLTLPADEYQEDLTETMIDSVFHVDPDEDGDPDDGRLLFQRFLSTSRRQKGL